MTYLLTLYLHLLATCAAVGIILATDLRVAAGLWSRAWNPEARQEPLRLAPPAPFVVRLVGSALAVLVVTGLALVVLAVEASPDALSNPKLQAKMLFVALLVFNAVALHRLTFAALARRRLAPRPGFAERLRRAAVLCAPVGVSQGLWLYCAFLGIARPWNHAVPLETVLAVGVAAAGLAWLGCSLLVAAASAPPESRVTAIPTLDIAPEPQTAHRAA